MNVRNVNDISAKNGSPPLKGDLFVSFDNVRKKIAGIRQTREKMRQLNNENLRLVFFFFLTHTGKGDKKISD
jgi:hypothetical protein